MYKVYIGLEVHCELTSKSKVFTSSKNEFSVEPNTHISEGDLGIPGILPVVNKEAVRKALKTSLALNCKTPDVLVFDRKNYFYPDLPKGYQITQDTKPIGVKGYLDIFVGEQEKRVMIKQIHLEEDTASLDHFKEYTLVDYNRSGVPLLETVTEPCLHSEDEALAFLEALRSFFLYLEVSEVRTERGQMRCDVNISLKKESDEELGTKVEIKNINSFSSVRDAIRYEIKRQTKLLQEGKKIVMETRRFDEDRRKTFSMREKVVAADYRYLLEPNIPPTRLSEELKQEVKQTIPMLAFERIKKYMGDYELSYYDSEVLVKDKGIADFFEACVEVGIDAKIASNWISGPILSYLNKFELKISDLELTPKMLKDLTEYVDRGTISLRQAREILVEALDKKAEPKKLIKELDVSQISDEEELLVLVKEVIEKFPSVVEEYKNGKLTVLDYLIGQIMKATKGKASPDLTSKLMKEMIEKGG